MARGDQVYVYRDVVGIPYEHHGIDCGDGTIIHYSKRNEATISRTVKSVFAQGKTVYVKSQVTAFIADVVVERAESRLGEQQYDLFFNNCEHFANWCKTGRSECLQLDNFGLRLDQIRLPQASDLARQAAQEETPERTLGLFREALGNIAIATDTLLPQYKTAMQDTLTWHQVAQKALTKEREDLARAAMYRKVDAKKKATDIKVQLNQLSELQLSLEQNKELAQSRLV
ncbi:MAG: lecithin retinol acyltransferase family protein [Cyanobacteria bacterium J06560_2]